MDWNPHTLSHDRDRLQPLFEVLVFLFLVIPSMLFSFLPVEAGKISFAMVALASMVRDLSLLGLVLYFIWRNGEPLSALGWTSRNRGREVLLGLVLFLPFFLGTAILAALLKQAGLSGLEEPPPYLVPSNGGEFVLAFVFLVVVAVAEETIFRGYLLLRFTRLLGSTWGAVTLSSVIFAIGHGYQGSAGVIAVGVLGVVYALVYLWRKSLVAPMVMHFLQNFSGVLVLPLYSPGSS